MSKIIFLLNIFTETEEVSLFNERVLYGVVWNTLFVNNPEDCNENKQTYS